MEQIFNPSLRNLILVSVDHFFKFYLIIKNNISLKENSEITENDTKLDIGTYIVVASSDNKLYSQKLVVK